MSELKTLKDMDHYHTTYEGEYSYDKEHGIKLCDLRQESIKWIKYMESDEYYDNCHKPEMFDLNSYDKVEVIPWIKHFFNITEEDLK